jgi:hypothetical protein
MTLVALGALWAAGASPKALAAHADSWTVDYNSNFAGAVLMQFSPTAVRMKFDKLGLTIITKGPKWNAVAFSDTTHSYMDMPYEEWKEKFNSGKFGGRTQKMLTAQKGEIKAQPTGKSKQIAGVKADQVVVNRNGKKICDVWLAASITPPKQVIELMHNMLQVPVDRGLPLTVTQFREGRPPVSLLDTNKIDKSPLSKDAFTMPKGLKKVKDEMALMVDESDLDFMTTTKPGAKPGQSPSPSPAPIPGKPTASSAPHPSPTPKPSR